MQQIIIGVSGGSGSGKTYFCNEFIKRFEERDVLLINADIYYKNELPKMVSPLTGQEYDDWNSPESLDYPRLSEDVRRALGQGIKLLIIEGAFIFCYKELREMMQLKIFIETDIELRLYRRIKRNMEIFKTEMEDIASYYLEAAKYQEQVYSTPSKIYADIIFNGAKEFSIPFEILDAYIKNNQ